MNNHPVLWGYCITFCLPGDNLYPERRILFTRRVIEPLKYVGPDKPAIEREYWMDEYDWPTGVPSPAQLYDTLKRYGNIHHVEMRVEGNNIDRDLDTPWDAMVQFFDSDDACALDSSDQDVDLLGWHV
jgi:hypothetical protein